jgi:regulator of protease activity HflC (stomatin/prohibitin superfamily)
MTFFGILIILAAIGALIGKIMAARSNTFRKAGINPTTLPYGYGSIFGGMLVGILLMIGGSATVQVPGGHRGVLSTFGAIDKNELGEGLNLVIPFAQHVELVEVKTTKQAVESNTVSKDLQPVNSSTALNYHINPSMAAELRATVSGDVGSTIIEPAMQEAIKFATAQFDIQNMIGNRDQVRDKAKQILIDKLTKYGIVLDEYTITDFSPSKKYMDAVEAKQISEQSAEKAKYDLEKVQTDAQQKVAVAQAEADALKAQRDQITSELLQLRTIENQRAAIEKWDGALPQNMYGSAPVPFLNLNK